MCLLQADVCFVIDASGSICGSGVSSNVCNNWALLLSFVSDIIDHFKVGESQTRVGVVAFSDDASLIFPLNVFYDIKELQQAISSIKYLGGTTNTGKALYATRTQCFSKESGEREGIPNIAIVITDGLPNVIEYDIFSEASALRQVATVLAVGVTTNAEKLLLTEISSPPQRENEQYFTSPNFSNLADLTEMVVDETCQVPTRSNANRQIGRVFLQFLTLIRIELSCFITYYCASNMLDIKSSFFQICIALDKLMFAS